MIDFRLYRLAFLPTLIAVVVLMFSLEGAPEPIEPATPPGTFEGERAASQARQIAGLAPERPPGSAGDEEIADLVTERFREIEAGAVTQQTFEADFEGDDVTLRNVVLTLPGEAGSTVVIFAARDSARGPGAASSAAATGVLIELASALGVAGHEKTYVLASTSGSAAGATGAAELLENLPERDSVEAAIVISQPGAAEPRPPFVVTSSTGKTSGPVQLERTAELAVEAQAQQRSTEPAAFTQLARLAIPSGLGGQAPLVADGVNAIAISAAGERPLPESEDTPDRLSGSSVDEFGRAIQSTVGAVDIATAELVHGPKAYLELSDNLVPGWTLAVLALALLLPAVVAAVDACARAARRSARLGAGLAWAAARSLPFVGALAVLYALAVVGAVPRPQFPFDPGLYEFGPRAVITIVVMAIAAGASAFALRRLGITAGNAPAPSVAALGAVAAGGCLVIWLANPYLALLLAPTAHVWLLAGADPSPLRGGAVTAASAIACLPAVVALAAVAGELDFGADAPWTYLLMVADGQIGLAVTVPLCFIGGALVGGIALVAQRRAQPPSST